MSRRVVSATKRAVSVAEGRTAARSGFLVHFRPAAIRDACVVIDYGRRGGTTRSIAPKSW